MNPNWDTSVRFKWKTVCCWMKPSHCINCWKTERISDGRKAVRYETHLPAAGIQHNKSYYVLCALGADVGFSSSVGSCQHLVCVSRCSAAAGFHLLTGATWHQLSTVYLLSCSSMFRCTLFKVQSICSIPFPTCAPVLHQAWLSEPPHLFLIDQSFSQYKYLHVSVPDHQPASVSSPFKFLCLVPEV